MDLGYDSWLARQHAEHEARQAAVDRRHDLIVERANSLGSDAERFVAWCAERGQPLADIEVRSGITGKSLPALAALIAHAPVWLRETAAAALCNGADLSMLDVRYVTGHRTNIEVALIAEAPEWLRAALVDWLSRESLFVAKVEAEEALS